MALLYLCRYKGRMLLDPVYLVLILHPELLSTKLAMVTEIAIFLMVPRLIFFLKFITYMEVPYGDLWYAAGNPDGFRFAAVNRRSPSRAIYNNESKQYLNQTQCLRIGRPSNRKTVPPYPPVGRRSLLDLPHHRWEPRFCRLGPPMCSFPQSGTEIAIILGPEALECLGV